MLDKIKKVLLYIVTPLTGLFAFIYFLLQKEHGLEDEIVELKQNQTNEKDQEAVNEATKESIGADANYEQLRAEYLRANPDVSTGDKGSGPSSSGQTEGS